MKKLLLLFLTLHTLAKAQKPIFTTAKVKAATVYFNSAELTQTASLVLPKGNSEILVKNVADYLNENTIQIGVPASVTVLSVQFTDNYVSEYEIDENSPAIKKVRDSIQLIKRELNKLSTEKVSNSKTIELLDKNQQVSGLNSGLNVSELTKMVEYYKLKRSELNNAITTIQEKEDRLNKNLLRLNEKLEINTKNEDRTSKGKLILQVMNNTAGVVNFDISYLTSNASWKPFYDLRANSISEPIEMLYKAQLIQNTGVDWKQVKLVLSSGNPSQNNQAPLLNTWFLRYGNERDKGYYNFGRLENELQGKVSGVTIEDNITYKKSLSEVTTISENQLNVSFDIDVPYDILSNGKAHSVALKEISLPATYKYYAAPRVEKEAFLLAEINDYSKYSLLQGEANVIFEDMYVGKTFIDPNQTSDTLSLSMGRDKKINITYEKIADKSGTRFFSSKKEQTFTYEITIRNNKKETVQLLLKDQYPLSTDKEIEIELKQSDNAKVDTETGILNWELKLKPNETKKIRLSYKVTYPKNRMIDNL